MELKTKRRVIVPLRRKNGTLLLVGIMAFASQIYVFWPLIEEKHFKSVDKK